MQSDGFYVNQNAAALVMRKGTELVVAFRGSNDFDGNTKDVYFNPSDPLDTQHPDKEDWTSMNEHYALFANLLSSLNGLSGLTKIYFTGHSLGGAMAIQALAENRAPLIPMAGVTFAAPAFVTGTVWRSDFKKDSRLTQVEIGNDGVALTWDYETPLFGANKRPGDRLVFWGSWVRNSDDFTPIPFFGYPSNSANHSMDLYLAIARQIDSDTWSNLLASSIDRQVMLGVSNGTGFAGVSEFIVDGYSSSRQETISSLESDLIFGPVFKDPMFPADTRFVEIDYAYGGLGDDTVDFRTAVRSMTVDGGNGNDILLSGSGVDLIYGGQGNDSINAGAGNDILFGNDGNDTILGGIGNDTIDGGYGLDTVIASHSANNYVLKLSPVGLIQLTHAVPVTQTNPLLASEGSDLLINVERIKFSDRTVTVETKSHGSYSDLPDTLYQFFAVGFGAAPGVTYMDQLAEAYRWWLPEYKNDTVRQIVEVFTTKTQFTSVYPQALYREDKGKYYQYSHDYSKTSAPLVIRAEVQKSEFDSQMSLLADELITRVVGNSANTKVRLAAVNDVKAAIDLGGEWTIGKVIYTIFGNLASKPLTDSDWGGTARQFANQVKVSKFYTDKLNQSTDDIVVLRSVMSAVSSATDVSTDYAIASLIGVALLNPPSG